MKTPLALLVLLAISVCAAPASAQSEDPPPWRGISPDQVEKCVTVGMFCTLVVMPDGKTAWGYSTDSGRWAKTWLHLPPGEPKLFVKMEYAGIEGEDAIHMFSKNTVTWTSLERKPGVPFKWIKQADSMAVLAMGGKVYTYSPRTAAWTSIDLLRD